MYNQFQMMTPTFKKLNYKTQKEIVVLNAPASFGEELLQMKAEATIITDINAAKQIEFVLIFATKQAEVNSSIKAIHKLLVNDAVLWICYPKGTSKKYTCDFNRDNGWAELGKLGFEPVRGVAIDEDWSALRFRKPEHIKTMTRSFALTEEGKVKAKLK